MMATSHKLLFFQKEADDEEPLFMLIGVLGALCSTFTRIERSFLVSKMIFLKS
jgi:hypothetical protein